MITVSKEDYLKSILAAESEGETVISARLADLLKVSPPAVTMAILALAKSPSNGVKGTHFLEIDISLDSGSKNREARSN